MNPWAMLGLLMILVVIIWLLMAVWDDTIDEPRRQARDEEGIRSWFTDGQDWRQ